MKIGHPNGEKRRVERSRMSAKTVELSRRELYDLVWSEAVSKVAARYDLSDVGLRKMCIKHRIPLPPRGYWQKVLAGKRVGPIPLPAMPNERTIELRTAPSPADRRAETSLYQPAIDAEAVSPPIVVPAKLTRPHAATDALRDALKGPPDRYGAVHGNTRDAFLVRVHPGSVSRALRIADAVAKACEARGFELKPGKENTTYGANLQAVVDGFPVCISLNERFRAEAYRASAADLEKERRGRYVYRPARVFIPTGQFTLKIDPVWGADVRGSWTDSKARPIEECLSEVMLSLRKLTIRRRIERAKAEERRARFDEEQRRRAALRATVEAERKRVETLEIEAAAWQRAENIRAFAAAKAARADPAGDADLAQWLAWAADQADRIDPLRATPPSVLDTPAGDIQPLSSWHC